MPADIVVKNGKIVNVYTKEIYDGGVAIAGDKIAAVGNVDYAIGENTKVIDANGNYITPGFIDGHIHPESSSLSIRSFAELVLKHGTTAIMTDLLNSMDLVNNTPGVTCQGHLPDMEGPALNACLAAGVTTDHESLNGEEAIARLRNGCHVMMREGSAARNMESCLKAILEEKLDTSRVSIVTDDLHTVDAVDNGHLDDAVRRAISYGADLATAIQMVSLNAARAFHLDDQIGGLAPGKRADVNITTGAEDFKVLSVIAGGKEIVDNGKCLVSYPKADHAPCLLNTTTLKNPITADSFKIMAPEGAKKVKVQVMDTLPWIPITQGREVELNVVDGVVQCDLEQGVLYIAQVERYGINGNVGKAFMGGFNMKEGAIASSVGHDNHNIIVMGTNFEDMAIAVNHIAAIGGGQTVVKNGEILATLEYPVCGLLSDLSAEELAAQKKHVNNIIHEMGSPIAIPFMFLSFICLAAIPCFAITDVGFINVLTQEVVSPILEVLE